MGKSHAVRVSFLLGAGVSLPAGMPSTDELTTIILQGNNWGRHTDAKYYPNYRGVNGNNSVIAVLKYLSVIKDEISQFYLEYEKDWRKFNYEVLYYVITQIDDSIHGEYENPVVYALVKKIEDRISAILSSNSLSNWDFERLSRESKQYVRCVIASCLSKPSTQNTHLGLIIDACRDLKSANIFSLNHDAILEAVLAKNNIGIVDGFGASVNGVRYWAPGVYDVTGDVIKFFKLHGSVNWYTFDGGKTGIVCNGDPDHSLNQQGDMQSSFGPAKILAGTFNKLLSYASGIYSELYFQFHRELKRSDTLVVSGYSFGDKGINSKIISWISDDLRRRLIVLHENPSELAMGARGAISSKWDHWIQQKRLIVIPKWLCNATWGEVVSAMSAPHNAACHDSSTGQSMTADC